MSTQSFDLIVIGTGSAGATTAKKCAKEGLKTAIIDFRPFGGTCPLRGCDPKKVLVGAANLIDANQRMRGHGIENGASINWRELMQFKRTFTESIPEATVKDMQEAGITSCHGKASFTDAQTIHINDKKVKAENILIATGAKPAPLPIDGFDLLTTSADFLELEQLPGKIVFVGGGYISFEFAHIAARVGADVEILHRQKQPLNGFDGDLVDVLMKKTEEIGITVNLETEVESVAKADSGFKITSKQNDKTLTITSDLVVHGAGRIPEIDELDLEKAGIKYDEKGVKVNSYLQSISNEHIYAAGDAAGTKGLPLTPLAGFESNIVTSNIINGNHKEAEYPTQPTTVFTIPPLASVGLTEEQGQEEGLTMNVNFKRTDDWYSSRRTNQRYTAFKTITEKGSDKIIGAHILNDHAEEVINTFALAINQNMTAKDLKKMLYSYPSFGSNIPAMV